MDLCRMQYCYSFPARSKCFQGLPNPCIRLANQSIRHTKKVDQRVSEIEAKVFLIPPKFAVTKKKLSAFSFQ